MGVTTYRALRFRGGIAVYVLSSDRLPSESKEDRQVKDSSNVFVRRECQLSHVREGGGERQGACITDGHKKHYGRA